MIYNALHRKLKITQYEQNRKPGVNLGVLDALRLAPVVLLLLKTCGQFMTNVAFVSDVDSIQHTQSTNSM